MELEKEIFYYINYFYRDIRSSTAYKDRSTSFSNRSEKFFTYAGTTTICGLPYLHYLRNHIGDLTMFYTDYFGWGYGMFSCNAGEHLNKRIKFS